MRQLRNSSRTTESQYGLGWQGPQRSSSSNFPCCGATQGYEKLDDGNNDVTIRRNENEQFAATEQGSAPSLLSTPPSLALSQLWCWSGCTVNQLSTLKWLKISPGIRFKKKVELFHWVRNPLTFQSREHGKAGKARASPRGVRLSVTQVLASAAHWTSHHTPAAFTPWRQLRWGALLGHPAPSLPQQQQLPGNKSLLPPNPGRLHCLQI